MLLTLTLELPDDVASQLCKDGRDLSRAALEAFAVEEYRAFRLTDLQFRELLGISRFEADAILKAHEVWLDYTVEDFRREGEMLKELRDRQAE